MRTTFTDLLSIDHPIMQAPIGMASGPELATSVCQAGGLGSIAVWPIPVDAVAERVKAVRERTARPFSVNVRADLDQHGHVAIALAAGAPCVHLFWGDPRPYAAAVHDAGAKLLCTVSSTDDVKQAIDAGADILIAQGWEAGGHVRGTMTTLTLVPAVIDLAPLVPVLAAGGVVDGRGLAAMLMLGAAGVAMGSRFVASQESRAHDVYKQAVVQGQACNTRHVANLFDGGWPSAPHRVLSNSTVRDWQAAGSPDPGQRPKEREAVAQRPDGSHIHRYSMSSPLAGMTGNLESMALYAGQGIDGICEVSTAKTIINSVMQQAAASLANVARLVGGNQSVPTLDERILPSSNPSAR